ncbi:MAG: ComF family protein [Candidatus Sphingomonas colombiensis]|nr:ComF family protein [Sphingomonas sp.]WEK42474.1 MAG: ComF family protein [Sphingomonas sp.]
MREAMRRMLALALPPRCPGCGAVTAADHRFCAACWGDLRFIGPPWCAACNAPFEFARGDGAQCAGCIANPPRHRGVRAAVAYGDVARILALKLKYGGRAAYAETIARQMARLMPTEAELLVPVPLHRWRMWRRGYNQAGLIVNALAGLTALPQDHRTLERIRATPVLRGLGARGRQAALRGAFRVVPGREPHVAGRAVMLVDDVHTSGATANAATATLLAAGAASVTILCWARVLEDVGPH